MTNKLRIGESNMSGHKLKVMIVDDYADNLDLLEDIFEHEYDVIRYESGEACLEAAPKEKPDLILLDVNMPQMDGYEVCERLKNNIETALIPIVFVSALVSPEERLRGYETGAEDYVTKPFKDEDIEEIVAGVLEHRQQTIAFENKNREATNTAFQAMSNSAELGQIIQFLQASYTYKSINTLAQGLLEVTSNFGLNCCVYIRWRYTKEFFGCDKDSIEAKALERFSDGERILDFGARTVVNDKHVSLLAKNMPLNKPEDYGRIKDHLTVLVNGSEGRAQSLEIESQLDEERERGIQSVLIRSHDELIEIRTLIKQQEKDTHAVISGLSDRIENIIFSLGLDEEQEKTIMAALDNAINEVNDLTQYSMRVEKSFNKFIDQLDGLLGH